MTVKKKVLIAITVCVVAAAGACMLYINDYYRASEDARMCAGVPEDGVEIVTEEDGVTVFRPAWSEPQAGIIFYPGGKVEAVSYAPLMTELAQRGIMAILVEMPGNLAVLDMDAAEGLVDKYPQSGEWYMAGHSLGGSMAASYLGKGNDAFDGLILLASYSTADLKDSGLKVISIYGSRDGILDMEKYEESRVNLPDGFTEHVIKGGCHAYFGDYGLQDGDGIAEISCNEQICETADVIENFIFRTCI